MGRFFNSSSKPKRNNKLLLYILIGVGTLIVIGLIITIIVIGNKNKAVLKKEGLTIGIGDKYPKAKDYFKKINKTAKIKADHSKCDNTKVGDCKVTITGDIKKVTTVLHIKDFIPPEVITKENVTINLGDTYSPEDFIESCTDNISDTCTIKFYDKDKDDNGNKIDYSSFTEEGTYIVKVYAIDEYKNKTNPIEVELIIGKDPNACEFGSMDYDTNAYAYPVSVETTVDNCPVDKMLYLDETIKQKANNQYNNDYNKLKTDMGTVLQREYPQGANITVCPSYIPVFNIENKGLVGYSIYIKVFVNTTKQINCSEQGMEEYIVVSYYLNKDGSRLYEKNQYNI